VPDENMPVAAAKPKVTPPKKAVAAPAKATGSKGLGSTGAASKGTGSGAASTLGKGTSSTATGTGGGGQWPLPPQPANPADVWKMSPRDRGRLIQDALAETDYKGWFQPDDITKRRNWPLIDFITNDHSHSVSLKTYDPVTKRFQDLTTMEDMLDHVEDLAFNAPGKRVTLDVRMPPGTPPQVMKDVADVVRLKVGRVPGFSVVVKTYP
jgi:hypothetical protein